MMTAFPYTLGPSAGRKARLGLVVLQTDETLEYEMRQLIPDHEVAIFTTRVASAPDVSTESLAQMERDLPQAVSLFPPVKCDVVAYGCTSGSSVIGTARVAELVHAGCTTAAVTNPVTALLAACAALEISSLAFLSPYVAPVSAHLRSTLTGAGVDTSSFGSFDEAVEAKVARIDQQSLIDAAVALFERNPKDAIFMSCTNLQTLSIIQEIEERCGVPVLSSNLCLIWQMLISAGLSPKSHETTRLLKKTAVYT